MILSYTLSLGATINLADSSQTGENWIQFLTDPANPGTGMPAYFQLNAPLGSGSLVGHLPAGMAAAAGPGNLTFGTADGSSLTYLTRNAGPVQYQFSESVGADGNIIDSASFDLMSAWNTIKNLSINGFSGDNLSVSNWVETRIDLTHNLDGSVDDRAHSIDIEGAKRGSVILGDGDQTVHVGLDSNGALASNQFNVTTGDGDNSVQIGDADQHYAANGLYYDPSTGTTHAFNIPAYDETWSSVAVTVGNGHNQIELDGVYANAVVQGGNGGDDIVVRDLGAHSISEATHLSISLGSGNNTVDIADAYATTSITGGDGSNSVLIQETGKADAPLVQSLAFTMGNGSNITAIYGDYSSVSYQAGAGVDILTIHGQTALDYTGGAGQAWITPGSGSALIQLGSGDTKLALGGTDGQTHAPDLTIWAGSGDDKFALETTDTAGNAAPWHNATIYNFSLANGDQLDAFAPTKDAWAMTQWNEGGPSAVRSGNDLIASFDTSGGHNETIVLKAFFTINAASLSAADLTASPDQQQITDIMHHVVLDGFADAGWATSAYGLQPEHIPNEALAAHEFMTF